MNELFEKYREYMTDNLILAIASNPVSTGENVPSKIKIRRTTAKGITVFQATRTIGPKEYHENLSADQAAKLLADSASPESDSAQHFRQIEIKSEQKSLVTLISKKNRITTKEHRNPSGNSLPADSQVKIPTGLYDSVNGPIITDTSHNRTKNYILTEGEPVPFLVELGVMTPAGAVVKARYDKFRQINRYLEFVEDILPSLPGDREISIIDFGCGKSYLTFALYYYLHEKKGLDVRITGLDLKKDVIAHCNALAAKFGYSKLNFLHGDIADYTGTDSVDMVVTLHACDTATDYAIYKAIKWGARVIFAVPCCQHEINKQIKDEKRDSTIMRYGLIKERISALYTDALRADMLEWKGYKTQILEFIDMEHTPKNILIRAVKPVRQMMPVSTGKWKQLIQNTMDELHINPTLYRLLTEDETNI